MSERAYRAALLAVCEAFRAEHGGQPGDGVAGLWARYAVARVGIADAELARLYATTRTMWERQHQACLFHGSRLRCGVGEG